MWQFVLALVTVVSAMDADVQRAHQPLPAASFTASSRTPIASLLNHHISRTIDTRPCASFSLQELDLLAETLLGARDERLETIYQAAADTRSLRHNSTGWSYETARAVAGGASMQMRDRLRDGKCAELAMIWVHHLAQSAQQTLVNLFKMPQMSLLEQTEEIAQNSSHFWIEQVVRKQISCAICHYSGPDKVLPERHGPNQPPVWPHQFHVQFNEVTHQFDKRLSETGSLHLDYPGQRMRWAHGQGQFNNWCECAGLAGDDARRACDIMSVKTKQDPQGAGYVVFRELGKCCKLAGWDKGFSPIRPDWLVRPQNATYLGEEQQGNRTCYKWVNPNHG